MALTESGARVDLFYTLYTDKKIPKSYRINFSILCTIWRLTRKLKEGSHTYINEVDFDGVPQQNN